jgi:hypothetical protein
MQALCLISVFLLSGCIDYFLPYALRYKITVEIETPEGIKTGSAVWEIRVWRNLVGVLPEANEVTYKISGEAAIVDLGDNKIVLALPNYFRFLDAFSISRKNKASLSSLKQLQLGEEREIEFNNYSLILFSDKNNPRSIATLTDKNIDNKLGTNLKIRKIRMTITDEAITWGEVRRHLKWFDTQRISLGRWNPDYPDPANYIQNYSLIKGEMK